MDQFSKNTNKNTIKRPFVWDYLGKPVTEK